MKSNIDGKGRIARAVSGILCIGFGASLWLIDWPESFTIRWIVTVLAVAAGVFQLFEARKSWCVVRACGWKTPM